MKHFSLRELTASATAGRLGIDNTPGPEARQNLTRLVENVLDPLREAYGHPITVTSGYRCPELNRAVGGAATSQHLAGEAADITAGGREANRELYRLLRELDLPVDQAIDEREFSWLHVSHSSKRCRRQYFSLK